MNTYGYPFNYQSIICTNVIILLKIKKQKMEALFRLVKSLDKSEKRYFSIYLTRHSADGNTHDAELFYIIEKLENPSDELLKQKITTKKIIANLSVYKHILYKNLLKCLNSYHSGKTLEDEVLELYKSSKILYDKSLYEESRKLIHKAKKIVRENELFNLWNMLSKMEDIIQKRLFIPENYEADVLNEFENDYQILKFQENYLQYREIDSKLFFHSKRWGINDKSLNAEHLPQLPNEHLYKTEKYALTQNATLKFLEINSLFQYKDGRYKESIALEKKIQKTIASNNNKYPYKLQDMLLSLDRMIWCYYMRMEFKKVDEIIETVKQLPDADINIRLIKFQLFTNVELMTKINTGDILNIAEIENRVKKFYKDFGQAISLQKQLILNYNLALLYFVAQDYNKSAEWLETLLSSAGKNVDLDIIISAKLVNIIMQYEQKMHSLVRYSIISTKRFIKRKRALNDFDQLFFSTIKKLADYSGDEKELLTNYYKKYYEMVKKNEPVDRCFSHYQWGISRAHKKPMNIVIQEVNNGTKTYS